MKILYFYNWNCHKYSVTCALIHFIHTFPTNITLLMTGGCSGTTCLKWGTTNRIVGQLATNKLSWAKMHYYFNKFDYKFWNENKFCAYYLYRSHGLYIFLLYIHIAFYIPKSELRTPASPTKLQISVHLVGIS